MDIGTGKIYPTREAAEAAGVPASDIAEVDLSNPLFPEVRFDTGPFKGRVYKRHPVTKQLVRMPTLETADA